MPTKASATESKRAGRDYGADLWQQGMMARLPDEVLLGPWTGDREAKREAKLQGYEPTAFTEAAKKEWLGAQREWVKYDRR